MFHFTKIKQLFHKWIEKKRVYQQKKSNILLNLRYRDNLQFHILSLRLTFFFVVEKKNYSKLRS